MDLPASTTVHDIPVSTYATALVNAKLTPTDAVVWMILHITPARTSRLCSLGRMHTLATNAGTRMAVLVLQCLVVTTHRLCVYCVLLHCPSQRASTVPGWLVSSALQDEQHAYACSACAAPLVYPSTYGVTCQVQMHYLAVDSMLQQ